MFQCHGSFHFALTLTREGCTERRYNLKICNLEGDTDIVGELRGCNGCVQGKGRGVCKHSTGRVRVRVSDLCFSSRHYEQLRYRMTAPSHVILKGEGHGIEMKTYFRF